MKIMIIGDGKIGSVLAEQLSKEKHEVTLVDRSGVRLDQSNNELDVMRATALPGRFSWRQERIRQTSSLPVPARTS